MPLTPEDVSNKRFTPVRLREGYDMGEVDQFLDEVEAELARLTRENEDLRAKLATAQNASLSARAPEVAPEPPKVIEERPAPAPVVVPETLTPRMPAETLRVETVPQASNAAARLLEIATRNADELVEEAKSAADRIIGEARTKAERIEADSKAKIERLEADARARAEMLDVETAERRRQAFGEMEQEADKLRAEVENLRSFEREYRSRLKSYFSQQLDALSSASESIAPVEEAPAPKRLRSILGEDEV